MSVAADTIDVATSNKRRLLVLAVRHQLGQPVGEEAAELLDEYIDWEALPIAANRHGVLVMVARLLDAIGASDSIPETAATAIRNSSLGLIALTETRWLQFASIAQPIADAAPATVMLKGPALGHGLYGDTFTRPFCDLDMLVSGEEWTAFRELVLELGFFPSGRDLPVLPQRLTDEDMLDHCLSFHRRDGLVLDCALDPFELGVRAKTLDRVFATSEVHDVDGVPLRVLSPEYQAVSLLTHLNRHGFSRLLWFADIGATFSSQRVDPDRFMRICAAESVCTIAAATLRHVDRLLNLQLDEDFLRRVDGGALARGVWAKAWPDQEIAGFGGQRDGLLVFSEQMPPRKLLANLILVGRPIPKFKYLLRRVFPPLAYLRERAEREDSGKSYPALLVQRYVNEVRRRRHAYELRQEVSESLKYQPIRPVAPLSDVRTLSEMAEEDPIAAEIAASQQADHEDEIRSTLAGGAAWNGLAQVSTRLFQVAVTVVLARLLTPADYGLVGVATIFTGFTAIFVELGMSTAIINRREFRDGQLSALLVINALFGLLLGCLLFLTAPLAAGFFRMPMLTPVLKFMAVGLPISGLGVVQTALLLKRFQFRKIAASDIFCSVVYGVVAIGLALAGAGVWSLAIGAIAMSAAQVLTRWKLSTWRPRSRPDFTGLAESIRYGGKVLGSQTAGYIRGQIDYVIIGRMLGAVSLGLYTIAFRISDFPKRHLVTIINRVATPMFARYQDDRERQRVAYKTTLRLVGPVVFPLLVGIAVTAEPFVLFVYGAKWAGAIFPLRMLALMGVLLSMAEVGSTMLLAAGRPGVQMLLIVGYAALLSILAYVAVPWGISAVAAAVLAATAIYFLALEVAVTARLRLRAADYWEALGPATVATSLMALAAGLALLAVPDSGSAGALLLATVSGATAYMVTLRILRVPELSDFARRMKHVLVADGFRRRARSTNTPEPKVDTPLVGSARQPGRPASASPDAMSPVGDPLGAGKWT